MKYLAGLLLTLSLAATASAAATSSPAPFTEGKNYQRVVPAQPTSAGPGQVEVIEFFWYGCPHCFAFEPYLENWLAHKPDNVVFRRIPATANPAWAPQAHAFYTAQVLGIVDKVHKPIFDEIQVKRHFLNSEQDFEQFFEKYGVGKQDFENAWNSFAVNTKLKQSKVLEERYRVLGVPTVIVAGKYSTGPQDVKNWQQLLQVVDYLVDKESKK